MTRGQGAILGALVLGGIGFVGGFVGPIVFTPEANQGPLLGIFITGPLGFIAGMFLGWFFGPALAKRRDSASPDRERR